MYTQSASVSGVGAGTLAATGYNTLALVLAAITLIFVGLNLLQVARLSRRTQP
jgi:hypothetical protein